MHLVRHTASTGLVLLAVCLCSLALAQPGTSPGIYTCIDGKGRRITADRPIAECMDRTQKQLSSSGLVKREMGPSLTTEERAALEQKEKVAAERRSRENKERKRDQALLTRYPTRVLHDRERAEALIPVEEAIRTSGKRSQELTAQRQAVHADLEFYKSTPGRVPVSLTRRLEENDSSLAALRRSLAEQEAERKRVNLRFDEELARLKPFWAVAANVSAGSVPDTRAKN